MIKRLTVALVGMLACTGPLLAQEPAANAPAPALMPTSPTAPVPAAPPTAPPAATAEVPSALAGGRRPCFSPPIPGPFTQPEPGMAIVNEAYNPGGPSLPILDDEADRGNVFWATGDYMVGWIRGDRLPPLATTSPPGTSAVMAGVLNSPNTSVVIGNTVVDSGVRSGGRFQVGTQVGGPVPAIGFEAGFMFLEELNNSFLASSNGSVILARPFFDASTTPNLPVATRIAFPGVSSGFVAVDTPSQAFTTVNADISKRFFTTDNLSIEGLAGYRFFSFGDDVQVTSQLTTIGGGFIPGTRITSQDVFNARNTFHGGEMGFRTRFLFLDRGSVELLYKLAVGDMHQTITTFGVTTSQVPGAAPVTSIGGLLALPSNINSVTFNNDWVLASEIGLNLGWQLTDYLRFRMGYNFMWWDGVARAGDQIDLVINRSQIPPATNPAARQPAFLAARTDLTINALNFGLEFRY